VDNLNQVFKAWARNHRLWKSCENPRNWVKKSLIKRWKSWRSTAAHGRLRRLGHQGRRGWKKTYTIQAQYRAEQFEKVLRFTTSPECRMAALVRHLDVAMRAARAGHAMWCDPAGPSSGSSGTRRRQSGDVQQIADELRAVDYKATGSLQRGIDSLES